MMLFLQANEAAPDAVKAAHAAYIAAGCRCITTNNFVATHFSLSKVQREADAAKLTQVWQICMCQQGPPRGWGSGSLP